MLESLVSPPFVAFFTEVDNVRFSHPREKPCMGSVYGCVDNAMEMHDPVVFRSVAVVCVAMTCTRAAFLIGGEDGDALPGGCAMVG